MQMIDKTPFSLEILDELVCEYFTGKLGILLVLEFLPIILKISFCSVLEQAIQVTFSYMPIIFETNK